MQTNLNNTLFNPFSRQFEPLPEMPAALEFLYRQARKRFDELLISLRCISTRPLDLIDFKACASIAARDTVGSDGDQYTVLVALLKQLYEPVPSS